MMSIYNNILFELILFNVAQLQIIPWCTLETIEM